MTNLITKKVTEKVSVNPALIEVMSLVLIGSRPEEGAIPLPYTTSLAHQVGRALYDLSAGVFAAIQPSNGRQTSVIRTTAGAYIGVTAHRPAEGQLFWTWQVHAANSRGRGNTDLLRQIRHRVAADYAQMGQTRKWVHGDVVREADYISKPTHIDQKDALVSAYSKHVVLRLLSAGQRIVLLGGRAEYVREDILFGMDAEAKYFANRAG